MKMNLKILTTKPHLLKRIDTYVENDDADKMRNMFDKYFPTMKILFVHDKIILETADLISTIQYEEDIDAYLLELRANMSELIKTYKDKKAKALQEYRRVIGQSKVNYTLANTSDFNYSEENVHEILKQLDAKDAYESYVDGYEYDRYVSYLWIIELIDESLYNKTHEVKKSNKIEELV